MAKVLTDLPPEMMKSLKRQVIPSEAPSGASKPSPAPAKGQGKGGAPKALEGATRSGVSADVPKARQRPGSGQRMNEYSEWMMRRCDAFGIASSKYFKKNGTCPAPK